MKKIKVYLDNCCYNRPYDDQSQFRINLEAKAKIEIQEQIRSEKITLVSSYVLVADIQKFMDDYSSIFIDISHYEKVRCISINIMKDGIKLMDACHLACAIIAGCDYFITTDKRVLKYKSDKIKILNPISYILEEDNV